MKHTATASKSFVRLVFIVLALRLTTIYYEIRASSFLSVSMITVHLHQIPQGNTLLLAGEVPCSDLGVLGLEEAGIEPVGPLHYELEVGLSGGGLFATGQISLQLKATCVSCLEPFEYELEIPDFALQKELSSAELVDLTDEIREDIHLLLPMHPRCTLGSKKCPVQFPQRVVSSLKNSEAPSVWAALDNITHL